MRITRVRTLLAIGVFALLLAACGSNNDADQAPDPVQDAITATEVAVELESATALVGTAWQAEYFGSPDDGVPVIPGTRLTVNYLVGRYAGSGGCNWFLGVYAVEGPSLRMQTPAMTALACEPVGIVEQEGTFMSSLENVTDYRIEDGKLLAFTVEAQLLLTMVPADEVPVEGTPWHLRFAVEDTFSVPPIPGTMITALFEGDQMSGSAGCNDYSATVAMDESGNFSVSDVKIGDTVCTDPEGIMDQETAFMTALESTRRYLKLAGALDLQGAGSEPLMLFGVEWEE
ncbi:MAG: META domain-containing protein [Caldilineaceae bacterium]|nr:META domain-containing protein [Caldilineaceae bacterium]